MFFFLSPKSHYCSLNTYKHCSPKLNNSTAILAPCLLIMSIVFYLLINSTSKKKSFLLFLYYFLTDPTPTIWMFNSSTGACMKSQDWLNYWWHLICLFDCDRTAFSLDSSSDIVGNVPPSMVGDSTGGFQISIFVPSLSAQ